MQINKQMDPDLETYEDKQLDPETCKDKQADPDSDTFDDKQADPEDCGDQQLDPDLETYEDKPANPEPYEDKQPDPDLEAYEDQQVDPDTIIPDPHHCGKLKRCFCPVYDRPVGNRVVTYLLIFKKLCYGPVHL